MHLGGGQGKGYIRHINKNHHNHYLATLHRVWFASDSLSYSALVPFSKDELLFPSTEQCLGLNVCSDSQKSYQLLSCGDAAWVVLKRTLGSQGTWVPNLATRGSQRAPNPESGAQSPTLPLTSRMVLSKSFPCRLMTLSKLLKITGALVTATVKMGVMPVLTWILHDMVRARYLNKRLTQDKHSILFRYCYCCCYLRWWGN